ncbi:MBL fold metallo-hydrolase [Paraburkholderia sp. CNPSo 3272]|uniref:MBL fold metallo-hydrolase n=1 Tax=Paraburkholderia sp. CNPSo 3272 TaxID=2940931 RepID=UPI0020B7956B|nr:MBL fold metallo-hydrolase [Paraburkholderia sp. CNPSo 3272]MCP3727460.1 MBL fold metallo-hydrolase [Paraburkholderia sp. CNPSo 3272]
MIEPVDSMEITVIVDNVTDNLSSNPENVETELAGAWRRGMKWLSGKCLCCAAHGLSCLITVRIGDASHSLLFDTGPDEWVFERNTVRLGLDLGKVGAMVLSHGHWDHAAAMPRALQMITLANGGRPVPTYMHPEMFLSRAVKTPQGRMMPMEDIPSQEVLAGNGADLIVTKVEQSVLSKSFYVSGEIPRLTSFERGMPGQHRLGPDGEWELDELLVDERFVAVHIANKGLFVFTACSHAGLINVLTHARNRFPDLPIYGVLGGFHLSGATESIIPDTVEALEQFSLSLIAAAHCTGWRAMGALADRFKDRVVPSAVGKRFLL